MKDGGLCCLRDDIGLLTWHVASELAAGVNVCRVWCRRHEWAEVSGQRSYCRPMYSNHQRHRSPLTHTDRRLVNAISSATFKIINHKHRRPMLLTAFARAEILYWSGVLCDERMSVCLTFNLHHIFYACCLYDRGSVSTNLTDNSTLMILCMQCNKVKATRKQFLSVRIRCKFCATRRWTFSSRLNTVFLTFSHVSSV